MESDSRKKLQKKRRRQRRQNAKKRLTSPVESESQSVQKEDTVQVQTPPPIVEMKAVAKPVGVETTKTREEILAERQAKKATKTTKKTGPTATAAPSKPVVPVVVKKDGPVKPVAAKSAPAPVVVKQQESVKPAQEPQKSKELVKPTGASEKSREEVMAERAAKKQVKQQQKAKPETPSEVKAATAPSVAAPVQSIAAPVQSVAAPEKTREEVMAERAAKKQAKQQQKGKSATEEPKPKLTTTQSVDETDRVAPATALTEKMAALTIEGGAVEAKAKPVLSKAERRAIQEAQRAAKAAAQLEKSNKPKEKPIKIADPKPVTPAKSENNKSVKVLQSRRPPTKPALHRVKLFSHLYADKIKFDRPIDDNTLHKEVTKLGLQYANNVIVGSNARCIAFLKAMKMVIQDYESNEQKDFSRELDTEFQPCVEFLEKCRPFSVSMKNALANIKMHKSQLNADESDEMKKAILLDSIDTYIRDQIEKAAQQISNSVQEKISNGDVILTYGSSSLIKRILKEANTKNDRFSVIVVDSRPSHEGQAMVERLVREGVKCKCVPIHALGFIMPEVTKVILGAHALLANGCVMGRVGTAQIALVAKSYNVPVLVCCETHKFSERVQTDAFVHNEIANPDDIMLKGYEDGAMNDWRSLAHLTPLNIRYDITPPEFVTAVITEIAILPCTSVPVILRIKPSEIGY